MSSPRLKCTEVIKVPFTGNVASFRDIVEAEEMMRQVAQSGAAGATVGRNVWGFADIPLAIETLKQAMFA